MGVKIHRKKGGDRKISSQSTNYRLISLHLKRFYFHARRGTYTPCKVFVKANQYNSAQQVERFTARIQVKTSIAPLYLNG